NGELSIAKESTIAIVAIEISSGTRVGEMRFAINQAEGRPLATIGDRVRVQGALEALQPISVTSGATRVSVEGIRIDGLVSSGSSEGTIVLKNAALHQSDGGLELNNVAVETPFATGTAKPREGKISAGALVVNGVELPVPT